MTMYKRFSFATDHRLCGAVGELSREDKDLILLILKLRFLLRLAKLRLNSITCIKENMSHDLGS